MADPDARIWAELERVRNRADTLWGALDDLRLRVKEVERRADEADKVRDKYVPILDAMIQSDEFEAFVSEQRARGNTLRLSRLQKAAVALVGLPTFVLGIVEIARLLGT